MSYRFGDIGGGRNIYDNDGPDLRGIQSDLDYLVLNKMAEETGYQDSPDSNEPTWFITLMKWIFVLIFLAGFIAWLNAK